MFRTKQYRSRASGGPGGRGDRKRTGNDLKGSTGENKNAGRDKKTGLFVFVFVGYQPTFYGFCLCFPWYFFSIFGMWATQKNGQFERPTAHVLRKALFGAASRGTHYIILLFFWLFLNSHCRFLSILPICPLFHCPLTAHASYIVLLCSVFLWDMNGLFFVFGQLNCPFLCRMASVAALRLIIVGKSAPVLGLLLLQTK
ncbi:MAG: hypothetical protein M1353_07750 [Nitrospirae bacterium]|nr:hypothetical protein [Nitrospirota bacterium]